MNIFPLNYLGVLFSLLFEKNEMPCMFPYGASHFFKRLIIVKFTVKYTLLAFQSTQLPVFTIFFRGHHLKFIHNSFKR